MRHSKHANTFQPDSIRYKARIATIRTITLLIAVGLQSVTLWAQTPELDQKQADFLYTTVKSGFGITPYGQGNAYYASPRGAESIAYNPAGLAVPGAEIKYEDMDYKGVNYASFNGFLFYISPVGIGKWARHTTDNMKVDVTAVGIGLRGRKGIDWGLSYKSIVADYGEKEDRGWSSDLGITAHVNRHLDIGISANDFMSDKLDIPTTYAAGFNLFSKNRDISLRTDFVFNRPKGKPNDINPHIGANIVITPGLEIRGGWFERNYTAGVSLVLPFMSIDYGAIMPENAESETQFMLGIRVGRGTVPKNTSRQYTIFKPDAYAEFSVAGNIVSGQSEISLLGGNKIGTNDLITLIHEARNDTTCKGFIVHVGGLKNNISTIGLIEEIRSELLKAKQDGKHVLIYLEDWASLPDYYLASIGTQISMPELGALYNLGLSLEINKTKEFFDRLGIRETIITSGKFKGSLNPNTGLLAQKERLLYTELVQDLYHTVLQNIQKDRNVEWEDIKTLFDGRLITAQQAKEAKLIDTLTYWTEPEKLKIHNVTADIKTESITEFYTPPGPSTVFSPDNRIAIIEIDGTITDGQTQTQSLFGGKRTGADDVNDIVDIIKKDTSIRATIIRVNSPGGSMIAADKMYHAIEKLKTTKRPVYASFGSMAASGGYYVAMNADKIYANPTSLTGSIGVISSFYKIDMLNKKLGIQTETIKTGEYMDMFSTSHPLSPQETQMIQDFQDQHYQVFLTKLSQNRRLTPEKASTLAQGQVFTGTQAKSENLVDELGTFYDTVDAISKKADIVEKPELLYFRRRSLPSLVGITKKLTGIFTGPQSKVNVHYIE